MKKIGILTLSSSDNCGSLLQTYALQTYIEKYLGEKVEIIDYSFAKSRLMYDVIPRNFFIHPRDTFFRLMSLKQLNKQKADYNTFRRKFIHYSEKTFRNEKELRTVSGRYETVICGSDQVWNVLMSDFDHAFFLDWVKSSKKIAYAVSLGGNRLLDGYNKKQLESIMDSYHAISVREQTGKIQIENVSHKNVTVCLDPTLILKKDDWNRIVGAPICNESYIFYYSYAYSDKKLNRIVQQYAEKNGKKVIVINASKWYRQRVNEYGFELCEDGGPQAFLNLMKYADKVFVQSFHGVIFSYIYEKDFFFLDDHTDLSLEPRIESILSLLDMKSRVVRSVDDIVDEHIDYNRDNDRLNSEKIVSEAFLRENV